MVTLERAEQMITATGRDPEVVKRGMGEGWQREAATCRANEFYYVVLRGVEYADGCARVAARKAKKNLPAGMEYCDRCGGVGGAEQWPGYTCFKCEGRGWVEPKEKGA